MGWEVKLWNDILDVDFAVIQAKMGWIFELTGLEVLVILTINVIRKH